MGHWTFNQALWGLGLSIFGLIVSISVFVWARMKEETVSQTAKVGTSADVIELRKAADERVSRRLKQRMSASESAGMDLALEPECIGAAEFAAGVGAAMLYDAVTEKPVAVETSEDSDADGDGGDGGD